MPELVGASVRGEVQNPDGGCEQVRRVRTGSGETAVPSASLGDGEIDSTLSVHIDASPKFVTADSRVIKAGDGAELDDGPR